MQQEGSVHMRLRNPKNACWAWVALPLAALFNSICAADSVDVLIVTGQHSHQWNKSTPMMRKILEKTPDIEVAVSRTPKKGSPVEAWDSWRPDFAQYDCIIVDYNQEAWPEPVNEAFEKYVAGGGGVMIIHAAKNAFAGWKAYEDMIGLLWRQPDFGYSLYYDADSQLVRDEAGQGPRAGHGSNYPWKMTTHDSMHPITRGFPKQWMHALDELYHAPRSRIRQRDIHILLSAWSETKKGGTGRGEPVLWWVPYGKGKCLTNTMGHVMGDTIQSMQCVAFQVTLIRGVQWLATGECSLPLPETFPVDEVLLREP